MEEGDAEGDCRGRAEGVADHILKISRSRLEIMMHFSKTESD